MASKRRDEYKKRILRHKRHKHRVLHTISTAGSSFWPGWLLSTSSCVKSGFREAGGWHKIAFTALKGKTRPHLKLLRLEYIVSLGPGLCFRRSHRLRGGRKGRPVRALCWAGRAAAPDFFSKFFFGWVRRPGTRDPGQMAAGGFWRSRGRKSRH